MSVDSKKTLEQISSWIQLSCVYFPGLSWQGCSQSDGDLDDQYSVDMKLFMVVAKQFKPICYRNTGDTLRRGEYFLSTHFRQGYQTLLPVMGYSR
ncbi:hypothetical protein PMIT1303_01850 [Prochlorococcus sp. MIT 1303]|nr:hypothetical protein PMIT1303_01850 [Prochlorococcus sp. MIT 1303]